MVKDLGHSILDLHKGDNFWLFVPYACQIKNNLVGIVYIVFENFNKESRYYEILS